MNEMTITLLFFACTSLAFMFSMGCCCSAPTCEICVDTGGDGPCGLNEVAGTVVIDASFVDMQASDSIALSDQTSGSEIEVRASTKLIAGDDGDECDILIKSNSDGTTCYFARLTVGASATIKLYSRTASVDTLLATSSCTAPEFEELELHICYGNGGLSARERVYGGFVGYALTTSVTTRPYAGVGVGAITTSVVFYDFAYYYGYNAGHSTCRGCYSSCIIASDDFNRANSTSIGADWTEEVPDWAINSNGLQTSTAGAIALFTGADYNPDEGVRVRATCTSGTVRYIIDWQDSNNYYCAEFSINGFSGYVKIIRRAGGSETVLVDKVMYLFTVADIGIAYDPRVGRIYAGDVSGSAVNAHYASASGIPQLTNRRVGLMNVSGTPVFDDFSIEQILGECVPPENCQACPDPNDAATIADQLEVTLAGIGEGSCGSCASLNGTYVLDLIGSYSFEHGSMGCAWRYTFPSSTCDETYLWCFHAPGGWTVFLSVHADPDLSTGMYWTNSSGASADCASNSVACTFVATNWTCTGGTAAITIPA